MSRNIFFLKIISMFHSEGGGGCWCCGMLYRYNKGENWRAEIEWKWVKGESKSRDRGWNRQRGGERCVGGESNLKNVCGGFRKISTLLSHPLSLFISLSLSFTLSLYLAELFSTHALYIIITTRIFHFMGREYSKHNAWTMFMVNQKNSYAVFVSHCIFWPRE